MVEWLRRQLLRDMECTVHDLEVMSSNPARVEFGMRTSIEVTLEQQHRQTLPPQNKTQNNPPSHTDTNDIKFLPPSPTQSVCHPLGDKSPIQRVSHANFVEAWV